MTISRRVGIGMILLLATTILGIGVVLGDPVPTYTSGQNVEIHKGDAWVAATIETHEGAQYQIKYADGTEEWVTPNRIRTATGDASATGDQGEQPKPKKPVWTVGQAVEVKWGGLFRKAKIIKVQGDWSLVNYEPGPFNEWVEPWRIREPGALYDIAFATPNQQLTTTTQDPPRKEVGRNPVDMPARITPSMTMTAGSRNPVAVDEVAVAKEEMNKLELDPLYRKSDRGQAALLDTSSPPAWTFAAEPEPARTSFHPTQLTGLGRINGLRLLSLASSKTQSSLVGVSYMNPTDVEVKIMEIAGQITLGSCNLGPDMALMDISPDGKKLVARTNGNGLGMRDVLVIWSVRPRTRKLWSFAPYLDASGGPASNRDVTDAKWLDENHIITQGGAETTLWQLEPLQAVWTAKGTEMALSPSGKTLVLKTKSAIELVEPLTGKVLGEIKADFAHDAGWGATMSLSPSGKTLLVSVDGVMRIWNLEKGEYVGATSFDPQGQTRPVLIDDRYALAGNSILYDCLKHLPIWRFIVPNNSASMMLGDGTAIYLIQEGMAFGVAPARFINPTVKAADDAANMMGMMAVQPGDSVSVEIEGEIPQDKKRQLLAKRKTQLEEMGFKVADGSPVRLLLSVAPGKPEERRYAYWGDFRGESAQSVTVTPLITSVSWQLDGKLLWGCSTAASLGFSLRLKQGQSLEQAAADAATVDYKLLGDSMVPDFVPAASVPSGLGVGHITIQGMTK